MDGTSSTFCLQNRDSAELVASAALFVLGRWPYISSVSPSMACRTPGNNNTAWIGSNYQLIHPFTVGKQLMRCCFRSEKICIVELRVHAVTWLLKTESHGTRHTAQVARHTSQLTHVTRHTAQVARHTSQLTHVTRHTAHVTRYTSHVTRHSSHITRHTSRVTRHT